MGRTAKAKTAPLADFLDVPATQEEQELDEFFDEIGPGTAVIHILRLKPDGSRPQVGKTTMDQIREDPWEFLRSTYGAGRFLLMFRGSDRRIHGAKTIEVEGPGPGIPLQKPADAHDRIMDTLLIALIQNMKPQPAPDMGSMLAGMAAIMTAIKPADTSKPVDPLAMFTSIVSMYQGLKPKEEKSELDRLRETAAVIKEFSGDAKESSAVDSPWGMVTEIGKQVVDKVAPALAGMMPGAGAPRPVQAIPAQPVARPAAVALPAVAGQPTATQPAPAQTSVEENIHRWLIAQIAFLKGKANIGQDPEFWAGYIVDNGEEPGCQALLYTLRRGATFENLLEFDPEIAQNPQLLMWFKEVFEGVTAELSQGNVDPGGQGRDARNAAPDVPSSTPGQSNGADKSISTVVS